MEREMSCEICYANFDSKAHVPKVLTACGHTICNECIACISQSNNSSTDFVCPKCKVTSQAKVNKLKGVAEFPTNLHILAVLDKVTGVSNCVHGSECQLHVCMNANCSNKVPFCLEDTSKKHAACKAELIIPMKKYVGTANALPDSRTPLRFMNTMMPMKARVIGTA